MQISHSIRILHLVLGDLQIIRSAGDGLLQTFLIGLVNAYGPLARAQHLLAINMLAESQRNSRYGSGNRGNSNDTDQFTTVTIHESTRLGFRHGTIDATNRKTSGSPLTSKLVFVGQGKIVGPWTISAMGSTRSMHFRPFPELVSCHVFSIPFTISIRPPAYYTDGMSTKRYPLTRKTYLGEGMIPER